MLHPNGSFSSCSGGTDTDRLTVGSRQQLGNYVNFRLGNYVSVHTWNSLSPDTSPSRSGEQ